MTPRRKLWLELALRAYPRAFRERFGDEIRADVRGKPGPRLYLRLIASGLAERWAALARVTSWPGGRHHLYQPQERRAPVWELFWTDVRQTSRMFRRLPGFTAGAAIVLALGIAINAAVFTVVHSVLLRPLPYDRPDEIVMVWSTDRDAGGRRDPVAPGDFEDFRSLQSFSGLTYALSFLNPMLIAGQEEAGPVQLLRASPDFLERRSPWCRCCWSRSPLWRAWARPSARPVSTPCWRCAGIERRPGPMPSWGAEATS